MIMRLRALVVLAMFLAVGTIRVWSQEPGKAAPSSQDEKIDEVLKDGFNLPVSDELAAQIDVTIPQLGSPIYQEREDATKQLVVIGAPAFVRLRTAYRETDELEARLRIEEIVHQAYLDYHVFDRNAFLGISQERIPRTHDDDPRIREDCFGVRVGRVIEKTAAQRTGIKKGDVIIALDGQPLEATSTHANTAFGESIRVRGPGVQVTFTILRGTRQFDMDVTLGRRPKRFYNRGQGIVMEMLAQADQNFAIWWTKNFHQLPAETSTAGDP